MGPEAAGAARRCPGWGLPRRNRCTAVGRWRARGGEHVRGLEGATVAPRYEGRAAGAFVQHMPMQVAFTAGQHTHTHMLHKAEIWTTAKPTVDQLLLTNPWAAPSTHWLLVWLISPTACPGAYRVVPGIIYLLHRSPHPPISPACRATPCSPPHHTQAHCVDLAHVACRYAALI